MSDTDALPAASSLPLATPSPLPAATSPALATSPAPAQDAPSAPAATPDRYDILVLDAGSRQSLASGRSLGRAGLRVALAESFDECDPSLPVLAFRSRYSARNVVLPSYAADLA